MAKTIRRLSEIIKKIKSNQDPKTLESNKGKRQKTFWQQHYEQKTRQVICNQNMENIAYTTTINKNVPMANFNVFLPIVLIIRQCSLSISSFECTTIRAECLTVRNVIVWSIAPHLVKITYRETFCNEHRFPLAHHNFPFKRFR